MNANQRIQFGRIDSDSDGEDDGGAGSSTDEATEAEAGNTASADSPEKKKSAAASPTPAAAVVSSIWNQGRLAELFLLISSLPRVQMFTKHDQKMPSWPFFGDTLCRRSTFVVGLEDRLGCPIQNAGQKSLMLLICRSFI